MFYVPLYCFFKVPLPFEKLCFSRQQIDSDVCFLLVFHNCFVSYEEFFIIDFNDFF
jgi:hypothetical protein